MKLLKWLLTMYVAKRFIRNTLAALVAQAALASDHQVGAAHIGLAVAIGGVTALFKALRDTYPNSKLVEYLPL